MDSMVSHSFASTGKCYILFFPPLQKKKNGVFSEVHSFSFIRTTPSFYQNFSSYRVAASVHFLVHDCSPLVTWSTHHYDNQSRLAFCDHYLLHFTAISNISLHCISLVFPFIRTLEFAQVRCTACITSRVANPIAEVRHEDRGTNKRNRKPIRAKYSVLHTQENWSGKAMYLQE